MTFLIALRPSSLPRLGAAALLAATALLGTTSGTVTDPATACAEPKGDSGFDADGYAKCVFSYPTDDPEFTSDDYEEAAFWCCGQFGGEWDFTIDNCVAPTGEDSAQVPRFPDLGDATATLTPAPPPPPAGPTATLTNVPPMQTG